MDKQQYDKVRLGQLGSNAGSENMIKLLTGLLTLTGGAVNF